MQPTNLTWRESFTVQDEKAAQLLAHGGHTLLYLAPFLGRESNTKAASLEIGVKLNVMAYWVKRLFEAGVLLQTRVQERRGSPVRYYRAVANQIIVPLELIPGTTDRELLQRFQAFNYDDFSHHVARMGRFLSQDWSLKYYREGESQGWTVEPNEPIALERLRQHYFHEWWYLSLNRAKADELRQDLTKLLEKYAPDHIPDPERRQYVLHVGFVQRD